MRFQIPILLLVFATGAASAAVYKWVDQDGRVHYGDVPPDAVSAETLELPAVSTYEYPSPASESPPGGAAPFAGYTFLFISAPTTGSTVRNNQSRVTVSVDLKPSLQPGHALIVLLDGRLSGEPSSSTRIELNGVKRGRHSLKVRVVDEAGLTLEESSTVYFYHRRHNNPREDEESVPPTGADSYKPNYIPDYKPPESGAPTPYQPDNSASPYSPGSSAPPFAPNYSP